MKGIGTDIVQIDRIRQVFAKQHQRFVQRLLTDNEQVQFSARKQSMSYLANRFAAKEAISKALGTGIAKGIRFVDIEVLSTSSGAPVVNLYGEAAERLSAIGGNQVLISLSDEKDYAVAFAAIN